MVLRSLFIFAISAVLCQAAWAQSSTFGLGKTPTPEEIRKWDIAIGPEGKELPQGSGSAKEGAPIYAQKCAACHGKNGYEGRAPQLIKFEPSGAPEKLPTCLQPCIRGNNVMGLHSPYAATIWDYINRGMPFGKEESLKPDEVYALTAYLLFKNGVIPEDKVLDQHTLPQVKMPNEKGYVLPEWKHGAPRIFTNKQ
jgi:S-disulfanyl-L-cysteine oxidoreductase SoxD